MLIENFIEINTITIILLVLLLLLGIIIEEQTNKRYKETYKTTKTSVS